jgi:hypothetical protein
VRAGRARLRPCSAALPFEATPAARDGIPARDRRP